MRRAMAMVVLAASAALAQAPAAAAPQKRALIVALSAYEPGTGWGPLSSAHDVGIIREALQKHGFAPADVKELADAQATKPGILRAIKDVLLDPAGPGDVLVFHYSGHGQQITDDAAEEVDGYDETLVPFNAPMSPGPDYMGDKHLRDDALAAELEALRRKVGPSGNVVFWLDSCNSGTGVRGTARVRGGAPPIGLPRPNAPAGPAARGKDDVVDFVDRGRPRGAAEAPVAGLAPYVVFSAASHDKLAFEIDLPGGGTSGSLSYALSRVLKDAGSDTTYLSVFEGLQREMLPVPNRPQREGDVNALLFSGRAVTQVPFLPVVSVTRGGSAVTVGGGTLGGLLDGSRVEVHAEGSRALASATLLAQGRVINPTPTTAEVALDAPADETRLARGRAFVTRYALGNLRIRVLAQGLGTGLLQDLKDVLRPIGAVELVDSTPDVVVKAVPVSPVHPGGIAVEVARTGVPLIAPPAGAHLADEVANRLQDYARNQYLRGMELSHPRLNAQLEMLPAKVSGCRDPARPTLHTCRVDPLPADTYRAPGGELRVPVDSYFMLRVQVSRKAHVAVLDLMPDGSIGVLWPPSGAQDPVPADGPHQLDVLYRLREPLGADTFLLVATESFVSFEPFRTEQRLRGLTPVSRGSLGAFGPLFDDGRLRTRGGDPLADTDSPAATARVLFDVVPAAPTP